MTPKALRRIIVLMSLALVGIMGIQTYSIVQTIRLNSEQFDHGVHAALDHVVTKLEQKEIENTASRYDLPEFHTVNMTTRGEEQAAVEVENISQALSQDSSIQLHYSSVDFEAGEVHGPERVFKYESRRSWKPSCKKDVFYSHFTIFYMHHNVVQDIPVKKRVSIKHLDAILKEELHQKGIDIPYHYGVYATREDSFVLQGQGGIMDLEVQQANILGLQLDDYKYKVNLFPSATNQLANLVLHFPNKSGYVWSSVWGNVLGSIIFTGIVMFCFFYTIRIIIQQKKISEMKNDFLNNMTHEFKTPIATISLATDSINNPNIMSRPEKIQRFVNIIQQENKRMHSQVEKVLQMARIDKRDFQLKIKEVDAHALILQAKDNISLQVEKRDGNVHTDLQATHYHLEVDETHFANVINNLLDNANKYSPETPEITLRTWDGSNGLYIAVKDEGLGISKEARKSIFDKFYRVPTGNVHDIKGFGLGLSYVKAIMTAHGGHIDLKSELGKGSEFILFFPYKHHAGQENAH